MINIYILIKYEFLKTKILGKVETKTYAMCCDQ